MTHNSDIKGAIVERVNRILKTMCVKYFIKYYTYSFLDITNKLLTGYINSGHSAIDMSLSKWSPYNICTVWGNMNILGVKITNARVKFEVGDLVRITNEKAKFAKGNEQTFWTKIIWVGQVYSAHAPTCLWTLFCIMFLSEATFTTINVPILRYHAEPKFD